MSQIYTGPVDPRMAQMMMIYKMQIMRAIECGCYIGGEETDLPEEDGIMFNDYPEDYENLETYNELYN